jgi:hypothetical protein
MMKSNARLANEAIERILELSADAQVGIRRAGKDSPEFHNLNGAINAYGKTIAVLIALQHREEFYGMTGEFDLSKFVSGRVH